MIDFNLYSCSAATAQRSESPRHPLAQLSQIENSPAFGSIQAFPRPVSESSYRLARHSHDTPILNRPFQASNSLLPIEGDGPGMFNGLGGIPHHSEIVGMFKNEEAPSYLQDPQQAESLSTALSGDFNGPSPLALPRVSCFLPLRGNKLTGSISSGRRCLV